MRTPERLVPEWPAPPRVRALMTTRRGGVSAPPYGSFNLGAHVGDEPAAVAANRAILRAAFELPAEPRWLAQVHGTRVVDASSAGAAPPEADASFARRSGAVCAVLVADCLPVLICDRAGTAVAAAHAGWRGLAAGVIEAAVRALDLPGRGLMAWLGPAIGPQRFEVGDEVRAAFAAEDPGAGGAFRPVASGKWLCDLHALARRRLAALGIDAVHGSAACTAGDARNFYSYRRDGRTGRMAALVWLEDRR